jgi:putative endopeptidase
MYMKKQIIHAFAAALLIASCTPQPRQTQAAQQVEPEQQAPPAPRDDPRFADNRSIDVANLDRSVSPCDNFYQFANGGWIKANPIPAAESRWSSFNELAEQNNTVLRQLLEEAAGSTAQAGTNAQKVGDFYASGMDSLAIERAGLAPIQPEIDRINNIRNLNGLLQTIAHHQTIGVSSVFNLGVHQDLKRSTEYALYAFQSGLGLPDRDYYLKDDSRSQRIRTEYVKHIQNMLALQQGNPNQAAQRAQRIMAIETRLARASMERITMRDPYAIYNKMSVRQANQLAPRLNFSQLMQQTNIRAVDSIIVGQPDFFREVNTMLTAVPLDDWKLYLRWHLLRSTAPYLPHAYVTENFNFYSRVLSGTREMQPRWKRTLRQTDNALGEALGQLYVDKTFTPEAKARALSMVNNLREAFTEHIQNIDWMSPETKQEANRKLDAFVSKIGYPDKWKDYSTLQIDRGPYVQNVLRSRQFEFRDNASRIGKPIDRTEWFMSPPTVNAYYNPSMNEIVFPAGILQPPFFDAKADDAVNYGGMGAVIGHELTHGFDDTGRQYDFEGNLKDWWTAKDAENFQQRASMVEKQFDQYRVLDTVPVSGKLTLGENIADLGGLNIAYTALQKAKRQNPNPVGNIAGFTQEQRFFLAWAQIWRVNATDEYLSQQVLTDTHSPGVYRVNGPLSNMPQFYEAFGCQPGSPMVRPESQRARIW